jgi:hypothetical protein
MVLQGFCRAPHLYLYLGRPDFNAVGLRGVIASRVIAGPIIKSSLPFTPYSMWNNP